jgi:hypothetical protein
MEALSKLWRWWTESWRSPERARKQYGFVAVAFGVMTAIAIAMGDGAVAAVGAVMVVSAAGLSIIAPRLVERTRRARDENTR